MSALTKTPTSYSKNFLSIFFLNLSSVFLVRVCRRHAEEQTASKAALSCANAVFFETPWLLDCYILLHHVDFYPLLLRCYTSSLDARLSNPFFALVSVDVLRERKYMVRGWLFSLSLLQHGGHLQICKGWLSTILARLRYCRLSLPGCIQRGHRGGGGQPTSHPNNELYRFLFVFWFCLCVFRAVPATSPLFRAILILFRSFFFSLFSHTFLLLLSKETTAVGLLACLLACLTGLTPKTRCER